MWIIEESHRGGPVRKFDYLFQYLFMYSSNISYLIGTQYTTELVLTNIQRDDNRFQTIVCSTKNGRTKREYIIDVICRILLLRYIYLII